MREPSLVHVTERRQRWRRWLCAVLAPIVLLAGVWLGGHPQVLPAPVADALVDRERRVVAEAIEKVDSTYVEEVDEAQLADAAIAGIVRDLDDEYSSSRRTATASSSTASRGRPASDGTGTPMARPSFRAAAP